MEPQVDSQLAPADAAPLVEVPKKRASVVNILGLLLIIDSTLMLLKRVPDMLLANSFFGPHPTPKQVYDTISMVVLFISSFGLLMRKKWARFVVLCLMLLSLAEGIFQFVVYNFMMDRINETGPPDSFLSWRAYQLLAGCLIYTFFIGMLFTRKVAAEFDSRKGGPRLKLRHLWQFTKILPLHLAGYRAIAIWTGAVLVLGLGVFTILSVDHAPRRSPPAARRVWTCMGNLGRTSSVAGRGIHRPDGLLWKKMLWPQSARFLLAAGDQLYVTNNQKLLALDASNGATRWTFTENPVSSNPLLIDDIVFVGTDIGALYGIEVADGRERWRFQTGKTTFKLNMTPIATAPITDGSAVYFGNALGCLYAVDLGSKKELWRFRTGGPIVSSPAIDNDTIYFGSYDGNLYALRLADGSRKWTYHAKRPLSSTPVVSGDQVLLRNEDGYVISLDLASGEEQWNFPAPSASRSSPAVAGETAFVGDKEGLLSALDLATGTVQWQFRANGAIAGTPVVADGIVYFGSDDRNLYAVDAVTGIERWRYQAESPVQSSPAIREFVVIFSDMNGTLYAIAENREAAAR